MYWRVLEFKIFFVFSKKYGTILKYKIRFRCVYQKRRTYLAYIRPEFDLQGHKIKKYFQELISVNIFCCS